MKRTTVFIIVDAGRADYVRPDCMPFVNGLSQDGVTGSFDSPPGFAQRTVLFSGRYPDTSGNFSAFVYDPENSPFTWVKKLGPMVDLLRPRKVMFPGRLALASLTHRFTGAYHTDPAWIPPRFLPYFRPCEDVRPVYEPGALGAPSLFDLCREHGRSFRYLAHPESDDDETHDTLVRELREGKTHDLFVAQFSILDEQGHSDGPLSDAMLDRHLPELDKKIASIHAALAANYDEWDLFVCGDHGMAPVHHQVDLLGAIKEVDAVPGEDYVIFINSTIGVFWYLTDKGKQAIEAKLPEIPGSRAIDTDERRRLRIPTDRRWGDRMLMAESGTMYWPDYFHVTNSKVAGMHGYIDKTDESYGMCVLICEDGRIEPMERGVRSLVDVFPTLCDLLGLPVPEENEGQSLANQKSRRPPRRRRTRPIMKLKEHAQ